MIQFLNTYSTTFCFRLQGLAELCEVPLFKENESSSSRRSADRKPRPQACLSRLSIESTTTYGSVGIFQFIPK